MADELFIMQRYWGSEDENSANSDHDSAPTNGFTDSNHLENESPQPKKKKRKKHSTECKEMELETNCSLPHNVKTNKNDETSNGLESSNVSNSPKGEKANTNNNIDNGLQSSQVTNSKKKKQKSKKKKLKTSETSENFQVIGQIKSEKDEGIAPVLPKWLRNPTIIGIDLHGQEIPISELSYLDDSSKKNLENAGIKFLFPVQQTVIPWLMQSSQLSILTRPSDLCVSAPTGSGKTLAFVIPIVQSLKSCLVRAIRAVVVLPVSELAVQVCKVFETFVAGTGLKVILTTGKKSFTAEQKKLVKKGPRVTLSLVDIIVTTPGRLLDHIYRTEGFCLQQLRYLVIDEADGLMNTIQAGWLKTIEDCVYRDQKSSLTINGKTLSNTPWSLGHLNQPLQKLLYSATLSHDPEKLHALSLYKPKLFTAQAESDDWIGKCPLPADLALQAVICKDGTKPLVLCHYLELKQFNKVICFTESVERAHRLHLILLEMGLEVREITSHNRPIQRKIILQQFNSGKVKLLICSDMVARGIDIEGVDCVVSYDVPTFLKTYVHRMGRTARAGEKGVGVTLLTAGEKAGFFKRLESAEMSMPELLQFEDTDLAMYVDAFVKALRIADLKLKSMKHGKVVFDKKPSEQEKVHPGE